MHTYSYIQIIDQPFFNNVYYMDINQINEKNYLLINNLLICLLSISRFLIYFSSFY